MFCWDTICIMNSSFIYWTLLIHRGKMLGRTKIEEFVKILLSLILCRCSFVNGSCASCSQISFNIKNGMNNRVLEDNGKLKETTVKNDVECFQNCYMDCRCTSFNVCGKICELNERNKFLLPNAVRIRRGCIHYAFPALQVNINIYESTKANEL